MSPWLTRICHHYRDRRSFVSRFCGSAQTAQFSRRGPIKRTSVKCRSNDRAPSRPLTQREAIWWWIGVEDHALDERSTGRWLRRSHRRPRRMLGAGRATASSRAPKCTRVELQSSLALLTGEDVLRAFRTNVLGMRFRLGQQLEWRCPANRPLRGYRASSFPPS